MFCLARSKNDISVYLLQITRSTFHLSFLLRNPYDIQQKQNQRKIDMSMTNIEFPTYRIY